MPRKEVLFFLIDMVELWNHFFLYFSSDFFYILLTTIALYFYRKGSRSSQVFNSNYAFARNENQKSKNNRCLSAEDTIANRTFFSKNPSVKKRSCERFLVWTSEILLRYLDSFDGHSIIAWTSKSLLRSIESSNSCSINAWAEESIGRILSRKSISWFRWKRNISKWIQCWLW